MKKPPEPLEEAEQKAVFKWAAIMETKWPELKYLNGSLTARKRSLFQQKKAKEAGMKPGKPDINLPVVRGGYAGLYIELKRQKSGNLKETQKNFLKFLSGQGYYACMCRGSDAAIIIINKYLQGAL